MKQQRLIKDYGKLSDSKLALRSKNVVDSLTGNPAFTDTIPSNADFTLLQTAYVTALNKTGNGDRQLIALKNQAKDALLNGMRQLSTDVEAIANGDKALLISSGFELASTGEGTSSLGLPTDFKITDGVNAGELKFSCKKAANAMAYNYEYTDEAPTDLTQWKVVPSTNREITVRGLRSGVRVYGRIKAIGRKNQEANSDVLSRVVQ